MNNPRLQFPHISRIFSATTVSRIGNLSLWLLLVALISFNILSWFSSPLSYAGKLFDTFTHPLSWETHVVLAQAFWQNGPKDQAIAELRLANELLLTENAPANSRVLGAQTDPKDMLTAWQNEPAAQKKREDYWQTILARHSDYRDAYVQLSSLSYDEGNLVQSHAYLLKAQMLDPNNITVNRLANFTSKLLE